MKTDALQLSVTQFLSHYMRSCVWELQSFSQQQIYN